jgi:sRNA-binding carbon storage regulator CsrA
MLVISVKKNGDVHIFIPEKYRSKGEPDRVVVTMVDTPAKGVAKLGFTAPPEWKILRGELLRSHEKPAQPPSGT